MSKNSVKQKIYRFIFILLSMSLFASLWAQGDRDGSPNGNTGVSGLEFVVSGEEKWCLTENECIISVVLPDISPAQVKVGNPQVPSGVDFLASSKELWVKDEQTGTAIRLSFRFSQGGTIQLPPLDVMVDGQLYQIPFAPIEVFQNPRSLKPQLGISFYDEFGSEISLEGLLSIPTGKPIFIQVNFQYVARFTGIEWDLVPNALFQQVENYEENFESTELSHQFLPAARFSLIPLKDGLFSLPPISLEVMGYDDKTYKLSTEPLAFLAQTVEGDVLVNSENIESLGALEAAFTAPPVIEEESVVEVSLETAEKLASLRWSERKSLPWNSIFQKRLQLEHELGLKPGEREGSWILGWIIVGVGLFILGILILSLVKKKVFLSVVLGFLCIIFLVLGTVYLVPLFRHTGILASQNLSIIPEQDASHLFPVTPYSLITIQDEVLGWYFVSADGLEGWIPKEMVILIKDAKRLVSEEN